jgi:hypothetical protein
MVGLMTLTWAWAENTLAMMIGVINENAGPIQGYPEPPVSLRKRVACFKIALREIPALKFLEQDGRALAARFIALGVRRNEFVHGAAWQVQEGGFQSLGVRVIKGQNMLQDHRFDVADAVRLNAEIAKLQDDAAEILLRVAGLFGGNPT